MLTTKELLKPRYLITAEDTSGNLKKGQILVLDEEAGAFWCGKTCYTDDQLKQWPHLFQRLEWWQDRKPEDMPEYVKLTSGTVLKITKYDFSINSIWVAGGECTLSAILTNTTPATLDEYLTYKNKNK